MTKKYSNTCARILKDGTQCPRTCVNEFCAKHTPHKNKIYVKCSDEGCEKMTFSKYGACSLHSNKIRHELSMGI